MYYWNEFISSINEIIKPGYTVFDAGSGDGHWKHKLIPGIKYIGMDLGVGDVNADYSYVDIKGDLRNIPLENDSVDAIICIQVLEHVPEPWLVLKELNRILKSNGKIFLSCPQGVPLHQEPYDFYRYTKYGLLHLFKESGFEIEFIKPQKGSINKISNDIRMLANELEETKKTKSFGLKMIAKILDITCRKEDEISFSNTTGYFVKALKN